MGAARPGKQGTIKIIFVLHFVNPPVPTDIPKVHAMLAAGVGIVIWRSRHSACIFV